MVPFYLLVLIPAFTQALLRLEWRPFITFLMISSILIIFCHFLKPIDNLAYQLGMWISVIMLCHKEYQRVSTPIYFDESKTCSESSRAWANYTFLFLSNIQDVILKTSIIGNFLDYGTVVPLTASGIGTGQSTSKAAVHTALGSRVRIGLGGAESKGQTTASSSPEYALVCIPKARQAYKMILEGSDAQINRKKLIILNLRNLIYMYYLACDSTTTVRNQATTRSTSSAVTFFFIALLCATSSK